MADNPERIRKYKDISISFEKNPVTNDIISKNNDNAVIQSVKNLVKIGRNEVPYTRLGTGLRDLLFQPIDAITASKIESEIIRTIEAHEPRVTLGQVRVVGIPDKNEYEVNIIFSIDNNLDPVTVNFFVERLR
jgi:phage baseplate assembly protein W